MPHTQKEGRKQNNNSLVARFMQVIQVGHGTGTTEFGYQVFQTRKTQGI